MPTYIPGAPRDPHTAPVAPALAPPALPGRRTAIPALAGEKPLTTASLKPTGRREIQRLASLAREAWEACGAKAAGIDCDTWRHDQVRLATGGTATGLRDLRRGDWRKVAALFLDLAGKSSSAFRVAKRVGHEDRDEALHKLREACAEAGVRYPDYPEAICRSQNKCALEIASAKQLRRLYYTVRNRRHVKRPHLPAAASTPAPHAKGGNSIPTQGNRSRGSAGALSDDIPL